MVTPPGRRVLGWLAAFWLTMGLMSAPSSTVDPGDSALEYEAAVAGHANAERAARELGPLVRSACLNRFAEQQAREMAQRRRLGHQDLEPVLTACGLYEVGENVAFGYAGGAAATAGWLASAPHRHNLLAPGHTLIGVGAHRDPNGQWYVSQVLAARGQDHQ